MSEWASKKSKTKIAGVLVYWIKNSIFTVYIVNIMKNKINFISGDLFEWISK